MASRTPYGILVLAALLVISGFALSLAGVRGTSGSTPVVPSGTRSFTLYGDAVDGWGNTSTSIREPGPTLIVTEGDIVTVHLYSNDSSPHNWFIDFDGSGTVTTGEPSSADFASPTTPVDYTFTVPTGHLGTSTYKCRIHPTSMTGSFVIQAVPPAPTFTLYGSATGGWGLTASSISSPGPTLNVSQGQTVTIDLYSADGSSHTFYIDWNRNGQFDSATETLKSFNSATIPVRYTFTASSGGNFTYYCSIHPTVMHGVIHVPSSTTTPPASPDYVVYAAVIVVIVVVAVAVALVLRRKPRMPAQPPAQP